MNRYLPVLMAQAKIYWDLENYAMVEKILMQSAEICMEHPVWRLNLAHVYFMQVRERGEGGSGLWTFGSTADVLFCFVLFCVVFCGVTCNVLVKLRNRNSKKLCDIMNLLFELKLMM